MQAEAAYASQSVVLESMGKVCNLGAERSVNGVGMCARW